MSWLRIFKCWTQMCGGKVACDEKGVYWKCCQCGKVTR